MQKCWNICISTYEKRRYWPKHVKGEEIKEHFSDKEVGYVDAIQCKLDGQDMHILGCTEPDYVLIFMTSFGSLKRIDSMNTRKVNDEQGNPKVVKYKYPEIASMHCQNRDAVDNHNSRRMFPIAIEEQTRTNRWPNRVFQFIIAMQLEITFLRKEWKNQPILGTC